MLQLLEIADIEVGKETNYCLNLSLVFPIIWIRLIKISVNSERKQKFAYPKNVQFGREIFSLSSVAHIRVDFKKSVSNLFHAGSTLVEIQAVTSCSTHKIDQEEADRLKSKYGNPILGASPTNPSCTCLQKYFSNL